LKSRKICNISIKNQQNFLEIKLKVLFFCGECPKTLIFLSSFFQFSVSKFSFKIPQNKKQNSWTLPAPTRFSFLFKFETKTWKKILMKFRESAMRKKRKWNYGRK
jgi:hypothetical protein